MSFAFLALYTGDYLRDTRHLTPLKHGVYLLLLMHCWDQKGPLPLDEQECAGIANCRSGDEVEALRYILERFFIRMEDGYYNKRMTEEVTRAVTLSASRSDAGKRGGAARMRRFRASKREAKALTDKSLKQVTDTCLTGDATPTLTTTPTPNTTPTPTPTPKENPYVSLARDVLQFLNEKAGKNFKPVTANIRLITARLKDGATETELRQVIAKKVREWIGDPKMQAYLRPATLFNREKFAQYQGELNAVS